MSAPPNMRMPLWLQQRQQSTPSPTPSDTRTIAKNKKTVKLFWKEIKEEESLLARLKKKKTIWDDIKPVAVDTAKLEHLFESRTKEMVSKVSVRSHEIDAAFYIAIRLIGLSVAPKTLPYYCRPLISSLPEAIEPVRRRDYITELV